MFRDISKHKSEVIAQAGHPTYAPLNMPAQQDHSGDGGSQGKKWWTV